MLSGSMYVIQELQGKVKEWRGKATASRQKVDEAKASQSENRSQGRVLDTLLKLKDQGRIEGFHVCPIAVGSRSLRNNSIIRVGSGV